MESFSSMPFCKICESPAFLMYTFFKIFVFVSKFSIFSYVSIQKLCMTRSFASRMRITWGDRKFRELHNCISLNCDQMSHFMLSQGKFVFAIFACGHEFLASDDASCAYQKHGGRSRQLASKASARHRLRPASH